MCFHQIKPPQHAGIPIERDPSSPMTPPGDSTVFETQDEAPSGGIKGQAEAAKSLTISSEHRYSADGVGGRKCRVGVVDRCLSTAPFLDFAQRTSPLTSMCGTRAFITSPSPPSLYLLVDQRGEPSCVTTIPGQSPLLGGEGREGANQSITWWPLSCKAASCLYASHGAGITIGPC